MRALIVVMLLAAAARADTPDQAKAAMHDYFDGEKTGGYILVGMGAGGVVAGSLLIKSHCGIRRGMAYPLLVVGTLHAAAGVYIHIASDNRTEKFNGEIDRDGQAWVVRERDRMAGVSTQFTVLKIVEVGLIAGGATMAYLGWRNGHPRVEGAGIAIAIEAAATLAFDFWAASRASDYRDDLDNLDLTTSRALVAPRTRMVLSHAFLF